MNRDQWQKILSRCDTDDDFKRALVMANNDAQTDSMGKKFLKNGTPEIMAARLDARRHRKYSTGWQKLDAYAMPRAGKVTLIPAYKHHGKSVMSMNMCYNMWKKYDDTNIIYYSFESDLDDISLFFSRMWYYDNYEKLTSERISQSDWDLRTINKNDNLHEVYKAAVADWSRRIFIRDDRISPAQLDVHLRSLIDEDINTGIVFIDYLQDMKVQERTGEHHADIEQMVISVEQISKEYGVATIIPAQYKRPDGYGKITKQSLIGEHRIFGSSGLSKKADLIYSLFNSTMFDYQFCSEPSIGAIEEMEIDILVARKQNYARNLTFAFDRKTGMIFESTRVVQDVQND